MQRYDPLDKAIGVAKEHSMSNRPTLELEALNEVRYEVGKLINPEI